MNQFLMRMTLAGGVACASAHAMAQAPVRTSTDPPAPAAPTAPAVSAPPPAEPSRAVPGLGAPLKPAQLASSRGGADTATAISDARLNATVTNNTATNVSSGNNTIDSGSFANMSGLPMVIQNTGANVLIQNATVINLQLR
ncbi:hypothetical protein [Massilia eurypsychrophila]|uniref:hypothetical protein n=1 Tax=Massilia eurypsychrophila TaxID=1485217 RepID=UPI0015D496EF|nr:hypothetical protein [Massilia eurypsychrophila]